MPAPRGFCPFPEGTPHGSAQPLVQGCGELLGGSPGSLRGLKIWKKFIWSSNFMLIMTSGRPLASLGRRGLGAGDPLLCPQAEAGRWDPPALCDFPRGLLGASLLPTHSVLSGLGAARAPSARQAATEPDLSQPGAFLVLAAGSWLRGPSSGSPQLPFSWCRALGRHRSDRNTFCLPSGSCPCHLWGFKHPVPVLTAHLEPSVGP